MASAALAPGFSDSAREAQHVFKALMWAMASPALPVPLDTNLAPPAPLTPELAALALALVDYETPFWLDATLAANPEVDAFLRFHTGAALAASPEAARFALVGDPARLPEFALFAQGEPDYPDRSATLLVAVGAFTVGPWTLGGPGIPGRRCFGASGLPEDFPRRLAANRSLFPLGVDLILSTPGRIAGLPRSIRPVEED